jgi:hypothetical protein
VIFVIYNNIGILKAEGPNMQNSKVKSPHSLSKNLPPDIHHPSDDDEDLLDDIHSCDEQLVASIDSAK